MGYPSYIVCGLVASPGDTQDARDLMPSVFRTWNNNHAETEGITLRSLLWEKDSFPSLAMSPQKAINTQLVDRADFLIAFFNNRVGSPTETEISGTVEEIKKFEAAQKPVLLYFSGADVSRHTATSDQFTKLAELQKEYTAKGLFKTYRDAHELETLVASHLPRVVREVKESIEKEKEKKKAEAAAIQVAVERNRFLRNIVERLNKFEKLTDRCVNRNPELKQKMARFFWRHLHGELVNKDVCNLFFESGSTIVYLAEEFIRHCNANHGPLNEWTIKTNNIITFLNFVLFERVDIVLSPYGPPDNEYGATFGALQLPDVDPPADEAEDWRLEPKTVVAVEKQASELLPLNAPSLILATASGLEVDGKHRYPGLHVGSFQNMLFKRAIVKSLHPVVFFLDEEKISSVSPKGKFEYKKCYPVFDDAKVWESVLASAPIAFCIGFQSAEKLKEIKGFFERKGFRQKIDQENVLFLRNPAWDSVFGKRVDVRI
jgi:hypothetical protein